MEREQYTILAIDDEGVAWRTANGLSEQPPFAIVSASLRLEPSDLAGYATRPFVVTTERASPQARARLEDVAEVIVAGDSNVDTVELITVDRSANK